MFSSAQMLCAAAIGAIAGALVNGFLVRGVMLGSRMLAAEEEERLRAKLAVATRALMLSLCAKCKRATARHREFDCDSAWHEGLSGLDLVAPAPVESRRARGRRTLDDRIADRLQSVETDNVDFPGRDGKP